MPNPRAKQRLMTRKEFDHFATGVVLFVSSPYALVPCHCGDVNCHGWRFVESRAETSEGVKCPFCGVRQDTVTNSRPTPSGAAIRRRRKCLGCHRQFTTHEVIWPGSTDRGARGPRRGSQGRPVL